MKRGLTLFTPPSRSPLCISSGLSLGTLDRQDAFTVEAEDVAPVGIGIVSIFRVPHVLVQLVSDFLCGLSRHLNFICHFHFPSVACHSDDSPQGESGERSCTLQSYTPKGSPSVLRCASRGMLAADVKGASHTNRRLRESGPGLSLKADGLTRSASLRDSASGRMTAGKDRHLSILGVG